MSAKKVKSKSNPGPTLLSGGNPQIAKGDGNAPVKAYLDAMPEWKSAVGKRLDKLIVKTCPRVQKAVKWNSPFYGTAELGYFVSFHCFTKYVKITFFRGAQLKPLPPVESKDVNTRYLHVYEDGVFDEAQFISWIEQASAMEGWKI